MTSLSLPVARRRFLIMLWLSLALHALVIGLTGLPPPVVVSVPQELEVRMAQAAADVKPAEPAPVTEPEPKPAPRPLTSSRPAPPQMQPQVAPQAATVSEAEPVAPPVAVVPSAPPSPARAQPQPGPAVAPARKAPGPALDIPLLADTRYYTAKELDVQPSVLRRPEPVYPFQAEARGVPGRVVIRLHVEADGRVSRTEVVSVTPGGAFGELFRKSTLDAFGAIRFRPAERNGQPVRALVEIPVLFEPER